jgi:hypothetical protein
MTDDDPGTAEPASAKKITALLREARSLSRRADKLRSTAHAVDDPGTQQLTAQACTTLDQLVDHLMTLQRHAQQRQKAAVRHQ